MPYVLEPLVAGELGDGTRLDPSTHPPAVDVVDFVLDAPAEDDLIESFPVYLVSEHIAELLSRAGLGGFTLEGARVSPSREYVEVYGDRPHKEYRWLRLRFSPDADCWLDNEHRLCVSERMMAVLSQGVLAGCDVTRLP